MPGAAAVACLLQSSTTPVKALYVGGVNVLVEPDSKRYGVPLQNINLSAAGPGGVSSLNFILDDPSKLVTISLFMPVMFMDLTLDYPLFAGYVTSYSYTPDFGQQGRSIQVDCTGAEVLLDWAIIAQDITIPILTRADTAFLSIVNAASGIGPLRAFSVGLDNGSQAGPVGQINVGCLTASAVTVAAGTTLREGLRALSGALYGTASLPFPFVIDVDFYWGLRIWNDGVVQPSDYTTLTVDEGSNRAENLQLAVDGTNLPAGVFVNTASALNKVLVENTLSITLGLMAGIGPQPIINDNVSGSLVEATAFGTAYLAQFSTSVRGSYEQSDRAGSATIHPGSLTTITNAEIGLTASSYRIAQIDKTFNPSGRENWTVSYGGMPPSVLRLIRRLTVEARA